jgi:hypothetical protein
LESSTQPYIFLWLLGLLLVAVALYVPPVGGLFWLGCLTLAFGFVLAYLRRGM